MKNGIKYSMLMLGILCLVHPIVAMEKQKRQLEPAAASSSTTGAKKAKLTHPLIEAIQESDLVALDKLLENEGIRHSINKPDAANITPLFHAVKKGNAAIVRRLVEAGAECTGTKAVETFVLACSYGHCDIVRYLLGLRPSLSTDHCKIKELLVIQNFEPMGSKNITGNNTINGIGAACLFGHAQLISLLVERGGSIHGTCVRGLNPLDIVFEKKHLEAAKVVVRHTTKTDIVRILERAFRYDFLALIEFLVDTYVPTMSHENKIQFLLHLAFSGNEALIEKMRPSLDNQEADALIFNGALHGCHLNILKQVLERNVVDVNVPITFERHWDGSFHAKLHPVNALDALLGYHLRDNSICNEVDVIPVLRFLDDLGLRSEHIFNFFNVAVKLNKFKIAACLLRLRVNVNGTDHNGKTPLMLVAESPFGEWKQAIDFLMDWRAKLPPLEQINQYPPLVRSYLAGKLTQKIGFLKFACKIGNCAAIEEFAATTSNEVPSYKVSLEDLPQAIRNELYPHHPGAPYVARGPMYIATVHGKAEAVRRLFRLGVGVDGVGFCRDCPHEINECSRIIAFKNYDKVLQAFIEYFTQKNELALLNPLLTYAVKYNRVAMVEQLLDAGIEVNNRSLPLITAVINNNEEMVVLLLRRGALTHYKDANKKDAFDYAQTAKIKQILQDAQQVNADNVTVFHEFFKIIETDKIPVTSIVTIPIRKDCHCLCMQLSLMTSSNMTK